MQSALTKWKCMCSRNESGEAMSIIASSTHISGWLNLPVSLRAISPRVTRGPSAIISLALPSLHQSKTKQYDDIVWAFAKPIDTAVGYSTKFCSRHSCKCQVRNTARHGCNKVVSNIQHETIQSTGAQASHKHQQTGTFANLIACPATPLTRSKECTSIFALQSNN